MTQDLAVADIPVVILCGGMGTRIRDVTDAVPKPLIDVGGRPILWHVMKTYDHFGFRRFVLCLGYRSFDIKQYFLRYRENLADFTLHLKGDHDAVVPQRGRQRGLGSHLRRDRAAHRNRRSDRPGAELRRHADLHAHLRRRARQRRCRRAARAPSCAGPYRDGHRRASDVALRRDERRRCQWSPSSTRSPPSRRASSAAGSSSSRHPFFDYLSADEGLFLEQEPLRRLAQDEQLSVFEHDGFWCGMDTYREYTLLNDLWNRGDAPWKVWRD